VTELPSLKKVHADLKAQLQELAAIKEEVEVMKVGRWVAGIHEGCDLWAPSLPGSRRRACCCGGR
jgi:hypothetical protein